MSRLAVGDIVVVATARERHRFCWQDGDARWVYHRGVGLRPDKLDCMSFFYVITAITEEVDARAKSSDLRFLAGGGPVYHCFTAAMTAESGYDSGFTADDAHTYMEKVEPRDVPTFVLQDAKRFLGREAGKLL